MVPAKKDPREDFGSAQSTRCVRGDALPLGPRKHGSLCARWLRLARGTPGALGRWVVRPPGQCGPGMLAV